jgi:hypothetical protein
MLESCPTDETVWAHANKKKFLSLEGRRNFFPVESFFGGGGGLSYLRCLVVDKREKKSLKFWFFYEKARNSAKLVQKKEHSEDRCVDA